MFSFPDSSKCLLPSQSISQMIRKHISDPSEDSCAKRLGQGYKMKKRGAALLIPDAVTALMAYLRGGTLSCLSECRSTHESHRASRDEEANAYGIQMAATNGPRDIPVTSNVQVWMPRQCLQCHLLNRAGSFPASIKKSADGLCVRTFRWSGHGSDPSRRPRAEEDPGQL